MRLRRHANIDCIEIPQFEHRFGALQHRRLGLLTQSSCSCQTDVGDDNFQSGYLLISKQMTLRDSSATKDSNLNHFYAPLTQVSLRVKLTMKLNFCGA